MLSIKGLNVNYGKTSILKNVSFAMHASEIVGIVGESGSGKSTIIKSIIGLLGKDGKITSGEINYRDENLLLKSKEEIRRIRGNQIALISQNPEAYLDPVETLGAQFYEAMRVHQSITKAEAFSHAKELFFSLGLQEGEKLLKAYPFELSGGMCQRAAIAIAMANAPQFLLADEPTSALDVTIQAQVLDVLERLRKEYRTGILMVTHNMGVISYLADKVGVMLHGELVEWGTKEEILSAPRHPYTKALIQAIPHTDGQLPKETHWSLEY